MLCEPCSPKLDDMHGQIAQKAALLTRVSIVLQNFNDVSQRSATRFFLITEKINRF